MTGQITLHGKVLRTHGIKEKILLARREKVWNLIIPLENKPDVEMLPKVITEGFNLLYVNTFKDVYNILFEEAEGRGNVVSELKAEALGAI